MQRQESRCGGLLLQKSVARDLGTGRGFGCGSMIWGRAPRQLGGPRGSSSDRLLSFQASQWGGNGSTMVSGPGPKSWQSSGAAACSLLGEKAILLIMASLTLTPLRPSASCSCSGAWCILLGATSGSEALIRRSQVWDPFPSVWLGVASLGDTDTCTYTETTGSERRKQAHTDTHIHRCPFSFTRLSSSYFLSGLSFLFPNTLLPQKSPKHTVYRPVCKLTKFPLAPSRGCLQNAGPERGAERGATTTATEDQPSPCLTTQSFLWPGASTTTKAE